MAEIRQFSLSPSVVAQQVAQEFARVFKIEWMTLLPNIMRQEHHFDHLHIDTLPAIMTEGTINARTRHTDIPTGGRAV
jgi:hypothetical protein